MSIISIVVADVCLGFLFSSSFVPAKTARVTSADAPPRWPCSPFVVGRGESNIKIRNVVNSHYCVLFSFDQVYFVLTFKVVFVSSMLLLSNLPLASIQPFVFVCHWHLHVTTTAHRLRESSLITSIEDLESLTIGTSSSVVGQVLVWPGLRPIWAKELPNDQRGGDGSLERAAERRHRWSHVSRRRERCHRYLWQRLRLRLHKEGDRF